MEANKGKIKGSKERKVGARNLKYLNKKGPEFVILKKVPDKNTVAMVTSNFMNNYT